MDEIPIPKDAARRMRLEEFYINAQLIFHRAGGRVKNKAMKNMSLNDFFRICALNGIDINFKRVKIHGI